VSRIFEKNTDWFESYCVDILFIGQIGERERERDIMLEHENLYAMVKKNVALI
jgi:hypothetical protein